MSSERAPDYRVDTFEKVRGSWLFARQVRFAELTTVELTPGPHTLQLVFANGQHVPFKPQLASDKITVTVK